MPCRQKILQTRTPSIPSPNVWACSARNLTCWVRGVKSDPLTGWGPVNRPTPQTCPERWITPLLKTLHLQSQPCGPTLWIPRIPQTLKGPYGEIAVQCVCKQGKRPSTAMLLEERAEQKTKQVPQIMRNRCEMFTTSIRLATSEKYKAYPELVHSHCQTFAKLRRGPPSSGGGPGSTRAPGAGGGRTVDFHSM